MKITRRRGYDRYTVLDTRIVEDQRLSYRAIGLLAFLLSRPDGWVTSAERLSIGFAREGRDAIRTALRELEVAGYLVRERLQDRETGQWRTESYVYDEPANPQVSPETDFQSSGAQPSGSQPSGSQSSLPTTDSNYGEKETCPGSADAGDGAQLSLLPDPQPPVSAERGRQRDVVWDALMSVCGVDTSSIPKSARGAYNKAVKELREAGADPDEIVRRGAIFRATWPDIRLTPTALVRRWSEVGDYVGNAGARRLREQADAADLAARMRQMDEADEQRRAQ